jgi:hypothetical protein
MATYECYVSFCDADADPQDVSVFISEMRSRVGSEVQIHYYHEHTYGLSFEQFIEKLAIVDCAVLLFSPQYKERVDTVRRRDSGVYREFERVVERQELAGSRTAKGLLVLPVAFKGRSLEEAVPRLFLGSQYTADLRTFQTMRINNQYMLPRSLRLVIEPVLDKIVTDLLADKFLRDAERSEDGGRIRKALVDNAELSRIPEIFQPKFERQQTALAIFRESYFVQTAVYRAVHRREHYLFSGRKGSGKTTLAQILLYDDDQKRTDRADRTPTIPAIDVQVDDWNLHAIFDDIILGQVSGDLSFIKNGALVFRCAWTIFVALAVVRAFRESPLKDQFALEAIFPREDVRTAFLGAEDRYSNLFYMSLTCIKLFSDQLITDAPDRKEIAFRAYLREQFNLSRLVEFVLGSGAKGLSILFAHAPSARILFCLDRFDTDIQMFRKDALRWKSQGDEGGVVHLHTEIRWLHGLVSVVAESKARDRLSPDKKVFDLFRQLDFFVVLPKDRLLEIQAGMRDAVAIVTAQPGARTVLPDRTAWMAW